MSKSMELIRAAEKRGVSLKTYPNTRSSELAIQKWEKSTGFFLPDDYKEYLHSVGQCAMNGALSRISHSFSVKIFPLKQVQLFSHAAFGDDAEIEIPETWYAIADAQDGNFIIMDMASVKGSYAKIIDGCWEYVPDLPIIALSFTEFLECSLADPNTSSGAGDLKTGARYWSTHGHYYGQTSDGELHSGT